MPMVQAHNQPYLEPMQVLPAHKTPETATYFDAIITCHPCHHHCLNLVSSLDTSHQYDQRIEARKCIIKGINKSFHIYITYVSIKIDV